MKLGHAIIIRDGRLVGAFSVIVSSRTFVLGSTWELRHVAEDGGGRGDGEVAVGQHRQLLERQLRPLHVLAPDTQPRVSSGPWTREVTW